MQIEHRDRRREGRIFLRECLKDADDTLLRFCLGSRRVAEVVSQGRHFRLVADDVRGGRDERVQTNRGLRGSRRQRPVSRLCESASRDLGIAIGNQSYRAERNTQEREKHLRPQPSRHEMPRRYFTL